MKKVLIFLPAVMAVCLLLTACGGGGSIDETRPLDQIKAEVEQMDLAQLEKTAAKYVEAIQSKQAEVEKVAAKLKEIPVTQLMGEDAQAVKAELSEIKDSVSALKKRLEVYVDQIKELGGDLSGLSI